jgi:hypothetical protein
MRPYLILAHEYRRTSAGIRVLHKLCHYLNEYGCEAWVTTDVVNDEWTEHVVDQDSIHWLIDEGIVVYPEVESNPLNATRIVRYLLNVPGRIRQAEFTQGEMTWAYCHLLRDHVPSDDRILFVPVVDEDVFRPCTSVWRNDLHLWWLGKGAGRRRVPETEGALEITFDWPDTAEELALLFQTSRLFYSYTLYTAMIIEARLCGCPTIVIPNGWWSREQFAVRTPGGMAGLAWGTSKQELTWAKRTVEGFQYDYHEDVQQFDGQLEQFVQQTQEWAK